MSLQAKSTLDGLPKQFVSSLKVLFDILDTEKSGLVRLSDIESRWKDGEVSGLPNGVLGALKKVTPATGKLTFERFVAGLKIALLRKKGDGVGNSPQNNITSSGSATSTGGLGPKPDLLNHDPSLNKRDPGHKPLKDHGPIAPDFAASPPLPASKNFPPTSRSSTYRPTTAAVRPNNAIVNQRSTSLSGMSPPDNRSTGVNHDITPPPNMPPPSAPPLRNDPFLQDPPPIPTEPRRAAPPSWHPTQGQYNDPYNNRGANLNPYSRYDNDTNNNTDAHGRNKDDVVFALKKWQQNHAQSYGAEAGNRLTDDQRLQALGRGPSEGRASIALASFENYGKFHIL